MNLEKMITKQQLARQRNWYKFRLSGMNFNFPNEVLTLDEHQFILDLNNKRNFLLAKFDENSRKLGLNPPLHKCWCGKAGKIEVKTPLGKYVWVCNKHKES